MSKLTLNDVTNIDSITTINANFDKLEQELQNKVLYRDNPVGEPNALQTNLDINGKDLLNVGKIYLNTGDTWASSSEIFAVQSAVEAARVQVDADKNTTIAAKDLTVTNTNTVTALYDLFDDRYLGVKSSDPVVDNDGNTLVQGALYFNDQVPKQMKVYNGAAWQAVATFNTTTTTSIDASLYASQVEAEQALNNTKVLTALRTAQAIAANTSVVHRTGDESISGVKTFSSSPIGVAGTLVKTSRFTAVSDSEAGIYTFTPDSKTKFILLDITGPGGSSGSAVANATGYVSYASPGGGGGRAIVRLNNDFSGGKITIGISGTGTYFENASATKGISVTSGPEGESSASFNSYPRRLSEGSSLALSPSSVGATGYVFNTDYMYLYVEKGATPSPGLALNSTTWCVPSRPSRGSQFSNLIWITPSNYSVFDSVGVGAESISPTFGMGAPGFYSSLSSPVGAELGSPGVMYVYEYS